MAEEKEFRHPLGTTADEDGPSGTVRVTVIIPGLKKKLIGDKASNATIDTKFEEKSFCILVTMKDESKKDKKEEKYKYDIKQLPDSIVPEKCSFKVKKDQVVLYLRKAKDRSWSRELDDTGLETYIEDKATSHLD
ncbi:unnamed protein product [Owenia fusiformis]|uniref:Uncharacterized protein n=1 Tax=Owenia fusiformis TaxID=6347 RepID=A0A8J1TDV3_OWEFU|nr:unnamed protein product [Owenia fusiformis]